MKPNTLNFPKTMSVDLADKPLNIAIVYSRVPIPMTRADQMTVAHLIEFLSSRGHNIDLYTQTNGRKIDDVGFEWLNKRCGNVFFFNHNILQKIIGLCTGVVRGWPLQVGLFYNSKQKRAVRDAFKKGKYDIAYSYYIRTAETLRGLCRNGEAEVKNTNNEKKRATFLAMQLSQSLNTRRMVKHFTNKRDLMLYSIESKLLRRYEASIWSDFSRSVLIGQKDVDEIRKCCQEYKLPEINNYIFSPHGVDIQRFSPCYNSISELPTLVFSGAMMTNTNVNAITWFVKNVWPDVKKVEPSVRLIIVGRNPAPEVLALKSINSIEVTGEVDDPAKYIAQATVCINPLQAGAGMQNKLLEYLSMGKAVVATTLANEGINAKVDEHIKIADSPKDFAKNVIELLHNDNAREQLGNSARKFIKDNWTWETHFMELETNMYNALMN